MFPLRVYERGGHLVWRELAQYRRLGTQVVELQRASDFRGRHAGKLAARRQLDRLYVLRDGGADSRYDAARAQLGEPRNIRTHSRALSFQGVTAPAMRDDAFIEKDGLAARRLLGWLGATGRRLARRSRP